MHDSLHKLIVIILGKYSLVFTSKQRATNTQSSVFVVIAHPEMLLALELNINDNKSTQNVEK